jgi:large subunit ribosomal protein L11
VPVIVTSNPKDRSFTFVTKTPPVSFFLKRAAGVTLGSKGGEAVGTVTLAQVYEIARVKQTDPALAHIPLDRLCASVVGTARSMGITVAAPPPAEGNLAAAPPT